MFNESLLIGKHLFQDGKRFEKLPFLGHIANKFRKLSCSLLRETTQVWLLQVCLPSLTESGGIDGTRQFGALTFHTLVEKPGVFGTTLLVGHDTLLVTVPFQPMLLHLSWLEMGNTRLLTASHLDLSLKKCLTFGGKQRQTQ